MFSIKLIEDSSDKKCKLSANSVTVRRVALNDPIFDRPYFLDDTLDDVALL